MALNLFTQDIKTTIQGDVIAPLQKGETQQAILAIPGILDVLYASIPEKNRISAGRYTIVKLFGAYLFDELKACGMDPLKIGAVLSHPENEYRVIGVGLGVLSFFGLGDYPAVLAYFRSAAISEHWEIREFAAAFFRKLVKKYPGELKPILVQWVQSEVPNLRRFVSEMLRPAVENRWLYKEIDYSLSILRHLFRESNPYPRTSVGNNLSDIARRQPELVYKLVEELVKMEDKNAYWIATRACRNLVKKEPLRVMDLLGVDEFRYKNRVHRRSDDQKE